MADNPKPTSPPVPAPSPATTDHSDVEALASDDGVSTATATAPPPESSEVNQADIDTLIAGLPANDAATASAAGTSESDAETIAGPAQPGDVVPDLAMSDEELGAGLSQAPKFETKPFDLPELAEPTDESIDASRVSMLHDVNLRVRVELGRTKMLVEEVLKLGEGSIVELEKLAGDPVDVYVNDRLLARGEVLVLNDSFCVRVSEVFTPDPHRVLT